MPRTIKQFEEIRENRKQQIMGVALKQFADKGFDSTSISSIAKQAHISKGLLYNYFNSKEDLLIQIVENGFNEMLNSFDVNKDGVLTQDEFIYFINEIFDLMSRKQDFYKLYFTLMLQPAVWKHFESTINDLLGPLLKTLAEYYREKGSSNPEVEALLAGAMLDGIGFNYIFNSSMLPMEEVKKMIIEKFVK